MTWDTILPFIKVACQVIRADRDTNPIRAGGQRRNRTVNCRQLLPRTSQAMVDQALATKSPRMRRSLSIEREPGPTSLRYA